MRRAFSLTLAFVSCLLATSACQASETAKTSKQEGDVAITAIDAFIAEQQIDKSRSGWKTRLPKPPKVDFDASKTYDWNLDTNVGEIKVKLLPDVAPMHVSSTIYLTRLGFASLRAPSGRLH